MDKEVSVIALVIVTILVVFVIVQPLIPSNSEKFSELGTLGSNLTISGYPQLVTPKNSSFTLYGYIGNHAGTAEYYQDVVQLGNNNTVISNETAVSAPPLEEYSYVLDNGQNVTFPMHLSLPSITTNQTMRLIFELFDYNTTSSTFAYTGLYNQIWINETT